MNNPFREPGELQSLGPQQISLHTQQFLLLLDFIAELVKREDVPEDLLVWARRILRHA